MNDIDRLINEAKDLLSGDKIDKEKFAEIENYLLRNYSRLKSDASLSALKEKADAIANRFNLPTIESQQEGFGLNSCAQ